jgi:hypothetical protein
MQVMLAVAPVAGRQPLALTGLRFCPAASVSMRCVDDDPMHPLPQQVAADRLDALLFGAAHQLDAGFRGLHHAAIGREVIERHATRGEARL